MLILGTVMRSVLLAPTLGVQGLALGLVESHEVLAQSSILSHSLWLSFLTPSVNLPVVLGLSGILSSLLQTWKASLSQQSKELSFTFKII